MIDCIAFTAHAVMNVDPVKRGFSGGVLAHLALVHRDTGVGD